MRCPFRLLSALLVLSLAGCATARNHLDPDRPIYESSFGVSRDSEAETPHVIRVVTFNHFPVWTTLRLD